MVIEHAFVTVLEAPAAMRAASEFLSARGFVNEGSGAFAVGENVWSRLEMKRGKTRRQAKSIAELPQRAHVAWDRGRITVALAVEPSAAWGGRRSFGFFDDASGLGNPKYMKLHQAMLISIANGLERVLVQNQPAETAAAEWVAVEAQIEEQRRRRSRRNWIVLAVVLAFFGGVIWLAIAFG